jgi:hypothetical protein
VRPKALWIEDSARLELANLTGPVLFNGTCHLTLAEDVTTAVELLLADRYAAVVVDIRLPPGRDAQWGAHYRRAGSSKVNAQLGLKLLYWLLRKDTSVYALDPPDWIRPEQVGVFSVETRHEVQSFLDELGISVFQEKTAGISDTTLDELIARLLAQGAGRPDAS